MIERTSPMVSPACIEMEPPSKLNLLWPIASLKDPDVENVTGLVEFKAMYVEKAHISDKLTWLPIARWPGIQEEWAGFATRCVACFKHNVPGLGKMAATTTPWSCNGKGSTCNFITVPGLQGNTASITWAFYNIATLDVDTASVV